MASLSEIAAELMQVDGIRERVMEAREIKAALYRIEDTAMSGVEMYKSDWKKLAEDRDSKIFNIRWIFLIIQVKMRKTYLWEHLF